MYSYIHKGGCGGVAFYYSHIPVSGQTFRFQDVTLIDGSKPDTAKRMTCGSCGGELGYARIDCVEGADKYFSERVWHLSRQGPKENGSA